MKFLEPTRKPEGMYTDNSLEFGKACEDLSWNHCTSTPHRSETNGIAERAVRRVKEGTSAVLMQSGLDNECWADSMECYCYLRNIQDLLSDGKTPYERSDILVADIEELEQLDSSEIFAKRLNAKKVLTTMKGDRFFFPVADGTVKISGGDQRTLIRDRPERGEEQEVFRGESDGSSPTPLQDSTLDGAEAKYDFWSITGDFIYRHQIGTHSETVHAERRLISYSTEVYRRCQSHSYVTGCIVGKTN